jgi:monoamine oxidase
MDRIPQALQAALGDIITFNAELLELRQDERGVRASFKDLKTGMQAQASADYCVCTVPPGVLSRIPADFDAACQAALRAPTAMPVGKIGLQMNRRFWEEDDDIFGGASQTDIAGHTQIAYPSYGWLGQRGVVQGYYNFMSDAIRISGMDHAARSEFALAQGEKVHPGQFRRHFDGQAISIAWHLVQYSFGGWEQWSEAARREHYGKLLEPQGRVVFAGTHLSHLAGWQAGAVESAWQQIGKLHALAQSGRSA